MRTFSVAAVAAFALALCASAAHAFPLSIAPGGPVTATSSSFVVQAGPLVVRCTSMSLGGTFGTGPVAGGGVIAAITGGSATCSPPVALVLPWQLQALALLLDSGGAIVGIAGKVANVTMLVGPCTYTGTIPVLIGQPSGSSQTMTVRPTDTRHPPLTGAPPALCPTARVVAGATFSISPVQTFS